MEKKKIAVLVGSLRKESYNRKLANEMIAMAPDSLEMELVGNRPTGALQRGSGSGSSYRVG